VLVTRGDLGARGHADADDGQGSKQDELSDRSEQSD
jgi:hypothetical protein